jgi:predicted Fe-Mo cluster-binding NifX family protein
MFLKPILRALWRRKHSAYRGAFVDEVIGGWADEKVTDTVPAGAGEYMGGNMKIAITSQGTELSSQMDPRFGRSRYLVIFDTDTAGNKLKVIDNEAAVQAAHGAGVATAQTVIRENVDMVVSGNFGPNAFRVLNAAGIKAAALPGATVEEAIEMVRQNKLNPIEGASV